MTRILILALLAVLLGGCKEEYRCVDGHIYSRRELTDGLWHMDDGQCVNLPDLPVVTP